MSAKLHLSIRVDLAQSRRVTLDGINLESNVIELKQSVSKEVQLPPDDLALIYCGNVLNDNDTLTANGVTSGVTVNVLRKVKKCPEKVPTASSESPFPLVAAFKNMIENTNYRAALQKLNRPEVLENIIAATPGLRDDPVSLAIIQDPELLSQLCDVATVRRIMEKHPSLVEAAHSIAALVHEEAGTSSTSQGPATAYSYTLDALSEDDDMESSQSSDSQPHMGEPSFNSTITSGQLAAALSAAQSIATQRQQQGEVPPANPGPITSDMISQALGQAFAATAPANSQQSTPSLPTPTTTTPRSQHPNARRLIEGLEQMNELGLRDDILNVQALQATDWNVQEAINLVFSGALTGHDQSTLD